MRIFFDVGVAVRAVQNAVNAQMKLVAIHPNTLAGAILQRLVAMARQAIRLRVQARSSPSQHPRQRCGRQNDRSTPTPPGPALTRIRFHSTTLPRRRTVLAPEEATTSLPGPLLQTSRNGE